MWTYLNEMPYWATLSNPDFHTSVTSQALVAWRRHDRNAETALPPTIHTQVSTDSLNVQDVMDIEGGRDVGGALK